MLIESIFPQPPYALTTWRVRSLPHTSKDLLYLGSLGNEDGRRKLFFLTPDHFEAFSVCSSFLLSQEGELMEKLQ